MKIHGLSRFTASDITSDMQSLRLGMKLDFAEVSAMGQYNLNVR